MTGGVIVYQCFRDKDVPPWVAACLGSVRAWSEANGWDYRLFHDEALDLVPHWFRRKAAGRLPVVADLARLLLARDLLAAGHRRVVWVDADVLLFDGAAVAWDDASPAAFGREIWVQPGRGGRLKVHRNVHNAICTFAAGGTLLPFYIDACLDLMARFEGPMVPQLLGPKLLTALHNVVGLRLIDGVAMASPLVARDLAAGGGPALDRLRRETPGRGGGLNLCLSLTGKTQDGVSLTPALMDRVCRRLVDASSTVFPDPSDRPVFRTAAGH